jgi:hypothetical protein
VAQSCNPSYLRGGDQERMSVQGQPRQKVCETPTTKKSTNRRIVFQGGQAYSETLSLK